MKDSILVETYLAESFGLSQKEVTLYLTLLKYKKMTILKLAEVTGINRSTTHVNIDSLIQKGLVTHLIKSRGKRRLITAEPIEKLALILKNKKTKIEEAEDRLGQISKELQSLKNENPADGKIEIKYYNGIDEVRLIYDDVLRADEVRSFANVTEIAKLFPENMNNFFNANKNNPNMHVWEILENSKETRAFVKKLPAERYYCRLTSKQLNLASMDYLIFDGKIAIIESSNKNVSGIIIENKNLYNNTKAIHKFVWNSLTDNQK